MLEFLPEVTENEDVGLDVVDDQDANDEVVDKEIVDGEEEEGVVVDVDLVFEDVAEENVEFDVTELDPEEVITKMRPGIEVKDVVELDVDSEIADVVELLDVGGSTELNEGVVSVAVDELDAVVNDDDVVLE